MLKRLGLTSEEVCEVGKWKKVAAFTSHYLRLGATEKVAEKISQMVHTVSPLKRAESDLTWTTGRHDPGGNVKEDVAQSNGETRPFSAGNVHCSGCQKVRPRVPYRFELAVGVSAGTFPRAAGQIGNEMGEGVSP